MCYCRVRVGADLSLKLVDELKRMYDTFLESVIPPGDVPLKCASALYCAGCGAACQDSWPMQDVAPGICQGEHREQREAGSGV